MIKTIFQYIGAILFLIYEGLWKFAKIPLNYIRFRPFMLYLGDKVSRMPAWAVLPLFLLPLAINEAFTLKGATFLPDIISFGAFFLLGKVFGFIPMRWVFENSKTQLLGIGWFAFCYGKLTDWKSRIHAYIISLPAWEKVSVLMANIKLAIINLKERIRIWAT